MNITNGTRRHVRMAGLGAALAIGIGFGGTRAEGAVYYEETFPNSSGAHTSLSTVGWSMYRGSSVTNVSDVTNANYRLDNTGIVFISPQNANHFFFTDEFAPVAQADLESIKFSVATVGPARVAVRVDTGTTGDSTDDSWFVTTSVFSTASSTTWDEKQFEWATDSTAWNNLAFVPGSSMGSDQTPTALPAGNITAAGIYYGRRTAGETINAAFRFDDFTIVTVPEPATATLIGLAACGLLARRRRG